MIIVYVFFLTWEIGWSPVSFDGDDRSKVLLECGDGSDVFEMSDSMREICSELFVERDLEGAVEYCSEHKVSDRYLLAD